MYDIIPCACGFSDAFHMRRAETALMEANWVECPECGLRTNVYRDEWSAGIAWTILVKDKMVEKLNARLAEKDAELKDWKDTVVNFKLSLEQRDKEIEELKSSCRRGMWRTPR